MADKLVCVVAVWRIRIHPVRVVSALIGGFLDRRAVHCQLPETQRYKRYRSLPYPHLAPKANSRDSKRANTRVRVTKVPSGVVARTGRATASSETATRKRQQSMSKEESKPKKRNRSENTSVNTKRTSSRRTTKVICFHIALLRSCRDFVLILCR